MNLKTLGSIVGICLILFVPFLGYVHLFDWDEINFAECAREMLESGNFSTVTIDYEPFWEKPPLFIWMQALSMKCFGVHAFGARFPNVLAAIATLLSILYHGTKHQNRKFALWWAAFYLGSFLPNLYFHSGIIDPWFNLFILNAIAFYFSGNTHRNHLHWLLCGIFAGLAVMTKGPVALILVGGSVFFYHLITRFKGFPSLKALVLVLFSTLVISLCWFFMLWVTGNTAIIEQFLAYQVRLFQTQDAGHGGPIYYHWLVLLLGCFPASFFALSSLFKKTTYAKRFSILILISGLLTLVLFSIVQTKIIHYSSFCYFFLCYFAALAVAQEQPKLTRTVLFAGVYLGAIALLVGALVYLQTYGPGIEKVLTIQDPFALQNLKAYTQWRWYDFTVVVLWLGAVIVSFYYAWKKRLTHAVGVLLLGIALGNVALKPTLLPHIEQYTQGAAIAFYEKHRDQNVYLITLGYKSYAHLFYGKIKPHTNPLRYNEAWVCADSTDLPAFYVARYPSQERYLQAYPNLKMLYMKHGFVFLAQKKNLSLKSQKK